MKGRGPARYEILRSLARTSRLAGAAWGEHRTGSLALRAVFEACVII